MNFCSVCFTWVNKYDSKICLKYQDLGKQKIIPWAINLPSIDRRFEDINSSRSDSVWLNELVRAIVLCVHF